MFAIASAIVSSRRTRTGFYMVPSILCTPDGSKKRLEEKGSCIWLLAMLVWNKDPPVGKLYIFPSSVTDTVSEGQF
jgi:hypothetical protein